VVTLLCDGGERYAHTYYSDAWLADQQLDLAPYTAVLQRFAATGRWDATA
jgi:cysteine synthase A